MWQRRHSSNIVAQVTPVEGIGTWDVCVFHSDDLATTWDGGRFGLLTDAHDAADALVATTFAHRCEDACGAWNAVERRRTPRTPTRGR